MNMQGGFQMQGMGMNRKGKRFRPTSAKGIPQKYKFFI
jgi:hypothetical protein